MNPMQPAALHVAHTFFLSLATPGPSCMSSSITCKLHNREAPATSEP